jgi:hypothetical protein
MPDSPLHRIESAAQGFALATIEREVLADHLGGRLFIENEIEAACRGSPD